MPKRISAIGCLLFTLHAFTAAAGVHYVDLNSTNPVSPYTSWATAATNIQDAVNHAGIGDTVWVTNGIYQYGGGSSAGSNRVYILNPITLQSVNGPAVTVIKGYQVPGTTNGANAVRCVYLNTGATLSGFTLTNGATPTFEYGAGVRCASTNCLVTNCVIAGNAAYDGGGGAYSGTLVNCSLIGNTAGPINIGSGGGASQSTLINCLLARNFAGYIGGAAMNSTLVNCTVVSNSAASYGGSVISCTLKNCIVYYNSSYYTGDDSNSTYNFTNCCVSFTVSPVAGVNNFTNPPLFANLSAGDYHLNAASPCLNAGNNSFITNSTDLDGNARIVTGTVDLGAYEFQAPVRYVNVSNTAPVSPFTSWISAATNIQDAVDTANVGDFIVVSNGLYKAGGRAVYGFATNRLVLDKAVTVQSVNGSASTFIIGISNLSTGLGMRCAYLTNGASLIGFTLTNGMARRSGNTTNEQSGGCVWCESSAATLSNCVLTGNYADAYGGAAYQGTLNNCVVSNNQAFLSGGGTYLANLNGCILAGNKLIQGSGGGGAAQGILNNCLVVSNFAPGYGGGAYQSTLNGCSVSNNSASFGGGVGLGVANNSLIASNRASSYGGGAFSNVLNNCILYTNRALSLGGGTYRGTLNNCAVVENISGGDGGGSYQSALNNCIVFYNSASSGSNYSGGVLSYCDTLPLPGGFGNITNDPAFLDIASVNFHLQANSPCINSGNNSYITNLTDFDGNARIAGGTVD
ncbi:MAG TPA: choice-of-anchor Q domain-containing protein, partial [Verrucomicrobiae bacterium]|nr:choice-of-anchor Q domain-containing protein [Verrucomicrobiae bacterium]